MDQKKPTTSAPAALKKPQVSGDPRAKGMNNRLVKKIPPSFWKRPDRPPSIHPGPRPPLFGKPLPVLVLCDRSRGKPPKYLVTRVPIRVRERRWLSGVRKDHHHGRDAARADMDRGALLIDEGDEYSTGVKTSYKKILKKSTKFAPNAVRPPQIR